MSRTTEIWTVYDHPADYPDDFVAIRFINQKPTNGVIIFPSLEEVSEALKNMGFMCLQFGEDDTKIIQVWMKEGDFN